MNHQFVPTEMHNDILTDMVMLHSAGDFCVVGAKVGRLKQIVFKISLNLITSGMRENGLSSRNGKKAGLQNDFHYALPS